ncbi:MAG: hypothetical protein BMS9Abin28_1644 [Anaerolineae bacterium]|nr:MAG: hypothetical protein BMS9Abin28_1644 [Anaerolineae bacterium]
MMGFGMGFGVLGLVLMLLLWVGLIAGAVLLVRALFPGANPSQPIARLTGGSARQTLDERYARGEISRAEYEAIKEDLRA